ncbi:MAG TPA: FkbM family methyltransferase [Candidatus Angelobacter sp.]
MEDKKISPAAPRRALPLAALSFLLRMGRVTRFSPSWRGVESLTELYRRIIPEDFLLRIKNIDGDLTFDVNLRGNMGLYLWHYPELFEKEEREMFCLSITPGCTVLDVGANIGFYTLLAAKRGARVFSIEADPLNVAMLRHHVEVNGFSKQVTIHQMAATDSVKKVPLYRHPFNLGESNILENGQICEMIEGATLDSLNLPSIDICKMDIEGAELLALRGMQDTLARSPRIKLFVEHADAFKNSQALLAYLRTNFSRLQIMEAPETDPHGNIPPHCNILALR